MYSLDFPNIFNVTNTKLLQDLDASKSNLAILLASARNALLGDPKFGTNLRIFLFEQNDRIVRDLIIDQIYEAIGIYMPQLVLKRNNIKVEQVEDKLTAIISCYDKQSHDSLKLSIDLLEGEQ